MGQEWYNKYTGASNISEEMKVRPTICQGRYSRVPEDPTVRESQETEPQRHTQSPTLLIIDSFNEQELNRDERSRVNPSVEENMNDNVAKRRVALARRIERDSATTRRIYE